MKSIRLVPIFAGITVGAAAANFLLRDTPENTPFSQPLGDSELTVEEMAAESWDDQFSTVASAAEREPVAAEDAAGFSIQFISETGYYNQTGEYVIDLLELDYAYLAIQLVANDGRLVQGAKPIFSLAGSSRLLQPDEVSSMPHTDDMGRVEFAVVGGELGLDRVSVSVGDTTADLLINIISLRAAGFPQLETIDGGIPWPQLMQARVSYEEQAIRATFPAAVAARNGDVVTLTGYMMPLETDTLQRRFLLTSNPPSCFFHIPGGPAGAIEVIADAGIEMSWDPVVLEGRFEALERSETGVIYRLHETHLLKD